MFEKFIEIGNAVAIRIAVGIDAPSVEILVFPKIRQAVPVRIPARIGINLVRDLVHPARICRSVKEAVVFGDFIAAFVVNPTNDVRAGG